MIKEPDGPLAFSRPFNWGVLFISDSDSAEMPELGPQGEISSNSHGVAVPVRHAQDVEITSQADDVVAPFEVSVRCSSGVSDVRELAFNAVVELSSGLMAIGDAEQEELLRLSPGRYRIQIEADPSFHPEWINVWYSPAD
jgi:hypothetical protein